MLASSVDPRIDQTRRKIKSAFRTLMEEKSFDRISITEIVKRAEINRSTFYDHYQDKYQLVIELFIETAFLQNEPSTATEDVVSSPEYVIDRLQRSLELCKEHKNISEVIFSQCFRSPYFQEISKYLTHFHFELQRGVLADEPAVIIPKEMLAQFCNAGFNYTFLLWINGDLPYSSRQMAIYVLKLNILLIAVLKGTDPKTLPIYEFAF